MIISDSHNHIHFKEFHTDLEDTINRAATEGVTLMLAVGIDPEDCLEALKIAQRHCGIYVSIGIHPQLANIFKAADVLKLAELCDKDYKVVAVGETGFDLYRTPESEDRQKELFRAHIELAKETGLPLVIHDRDAHVQTLSILDNTDAWSLGGVFHCFSGDADMADFVTNKGFFISIPGVVTYKNAHLLKDVVKKTPLDRLLVETDAPYLTPQPFRGRRNEPAYTAKIIEEIARIKGATSEEVARITTENFKKLFLSKSVH